MNWELNQAKKKEKKERKLYIKILKMFFKILLTLFLYCSPNISLYKTSALYYIHVIQYNIKL